MDQLLEPFDSKLDIFAFVLFVLIFPVYHSLYLWLGSILKEKAVRVRFDLYRESWLKYLIESRDLITAAQQTRNLTMVNTVLVSSALILIGLTANILFSSPIIGDQVAQPQGSDMHPDNLRIKLYMLILVFALAFSFCMTSLLHLGHFVLLIGADPKLIETYEGSPVKYFSTLINRASHRHTLGVRCFYSAFPLFVWLFDTWLFLFITAFWGIRFIFFQDFRINRKVDI